MRKIRRFLLAIFTVIGVIIVWKQICQRTTIQATKNQRERIDSYSENEKVIDAIALNCVTYGCERAKNLSGTVAELATNNDMGIINKNYDIVRSDPEDPESAAFSVKDFVLREVGDFRLIFSKKEQKSGFFGTVFADDTNQCCWVCFAGAVDRIDILASIKTVIIPGLSAQERAAFAFYEDALKIPEIAEKGYNVLLSGHSLGGIFATEISRETDCEAVTINGADGVGMWKINNISGEKKSSDLISNYMTSPKYGKFAFMDFVQHLMYLGPYRTVNYHIYNENGYTDDTHSVFSFIWFEDEALEKPILPSTEK